MTMVESLASEFAHETETTRKHLERLPEDKLDWRPHEKSFTARDLGSHIVECASWVDSIFTSDHFDFNPATYKAFRAASVADLIKAFDERVTSGKRVLAGVKDADLVRPWQLKIMGRVKFERPRATVMRDFTLSHLIHHRGQLSVYLRLLNVPVPGSYGPTADEAVQMP